MEIRLKPSHFWDPEPELSDKVYDTVVFENGKGLQSRLIDMFNQDHSSWKRRQVKPNAIADHNYTKSLGFKSSEDKRRYDKDLKHHESHRLRYSGFQKDLENSYCSSQVWVQWSKDNLFQIQTHDECIYSGAIPSTDLFELILSENNIPIKKI